MPRQPAALSSLPPAVSRSLRSLGEDLAIARVRRKEPQRAWARRIGVSVPTLIRMERGDPGVSMGIYATALWLVGGLPVIEKAADPGSDRGAIERDVNEAANRRAVRSAASAEARLRGKKKS